MTCSLESAVLETARGLTCIAKSRDLPLAMGQETPVLWSEPVLEKVSCSARQRKGTGRLREKLKIGFISVFYNCFWLVSGKAVSESEHYPCKPREHVMPLVQVTLLAVAEPGLEPRGGLLSRWRGQGREPLGLRSGRPQARPAPCRVPLRPEAASGFPAACPCRWPVQEKEALDSTLTDCR